MDGERDEDEDEEMGRLIIFKPSKPCVASQRMGEAFQMLWY